MSIRRTALLIALSAASLHAQAVPSPFRLAGIDLQVDIDYAKQRLTGRAELVVENWSTREAGVVALQVGRLMKVSAVTDAAGRPLPFEQAIVVYPDWTLRQVNAVRVTLPRAVAGQDSTRLVVQYEGHLAGAAETGMSYVRERLDPAFTVLRSESFGFPEIGEASVAALRGTPRRDFWFSARITVPDTLVVATGGEQVRRTVQSGRATYQLRSRAPVPFLNLTIAPYRVYERGSVRAYILPADTAQAEALMSALARSMQWFTDRYGELNEPPAFSVMEIPDGYGSQASLSAGIMIEASALRRVENRRALYHEISHLWNAHDAETPSARWNEGLASYLEYRVAHELDGMPREEGLQWHAQSLCNRIKTSEALRTTPLAGYGSANMTGSSYGVGALLFGVLESIMGSAAFDRTYRALYQQTKAATVSVDQLESAFVRADARTRVVFQDFVRSTAWQQSLCPAGDLNVLIARYR